MGINKIVYNGGTLIDLTGDTVTADKLMQGYTAHDKSGEVIIGTATGGGGAVIQDEDGGLHFLEDGVNAFSDAITTLPNGGLHHVITGVMASGGGLEYESGSVTISTSLSTPYDIEFSNTHTTAPFMFVIAYAGTGIPSGATMVTETFAMNEAIDSAPSTESYHTIYGSVGRLYLNSSGVLTKGMFEILTSASSSSESSTNNARYWATESRIRLYATSTAYLRSSYNWIAIWAPTT